MQEQDRRWMNRALDLAENGRGFVEPNPLVGAVLVRNGTIVGEGWHERYGEAHAEVNALRQAGEMARGATLYVTLEPCCHHGKTPPCTDAVIRAGVSRVVAAMSDPFSQVNRQGITQLTQAGIRVEVGICEQRAKRINAPYLKLVASGIPYVHAKWAMTLDGKIATRTGDSKWISNPASRRRVHELRGRMDAIIVGIGTALADDPMLTARPPGPRVATRILLDTHGRLPLESKLVQTADEYPTILVVGKSIEKERRESYEKRNVEILESGQNNVALLLKELGNRRFTNVLVEGGAQVLGSFFDEREIDEVHAFIAPVIAGGINAKTAVGGAGVAEISQAFRFDGSAELLDGDVYWHGWKEIGR